MDFGYLPTRDEGTLMISVISIAKNECEFDALRRALANQTYRNFELVTSTKPKIPEAWNDAISRASGDFLVFTETDALPQSDRWLQQIALNVRKGVIIKGLEIRPSDLDLCDLVCDASVFEDLKFDESFQICEDTELFARLRKMGIKIEFANDFPVIHCPSQGWRKTMSRGLRSGMYFMKIIYLHGRRNIDDVNTRNFRGSYVHPVSNRLRIIVENSLVLFGLLIGAVRYLPILVRGKIAQRVLKADKST